MTLIQHKWRSDTAANWASANPVLLNGEPGWESDTGRFKVGDGITAWNLLPYFENTVDVSATFQTQIDLLGPRQIVRYLTDDVFVPTDYPWLKYVDVTVIGGGGPGGGARAINNQSATGGDGGGAGGAMDVFPVSALNPLGETVTVATSKPGGVGGTNPVNSTGGPSSFGSLVVANGGGRGSSDNSVTAYNASYFGPGGGARGSAGAGTVGTILANGSDGGDGWLIGGRADFSLGGGSSAFGFAGRQARSSSNTFDGIDGLNYGGGGTGASNSSSGSSAAKNGGDGAPGIVIVKLFG